MSGAFDFKKYYKHRYDPVWRLKLDMMMRRTSDRMDIEAFWRARGIPEDKRDVLFKLLRGSLEKPEGTDGKSIKVTPESYAKMTDQQRTDLYNSIVTSVLGPGHEFKLK